MHPQARPVNLYPNQEQSTPVLGAYHLIASPTSDSSTGKPMSYVDPKSDSAFVDKIQVLTQGKNNPALPDSFEHSRLGDLIALH